MTSSKINSERTLCFILDETRILLAMKKTGQGAGNINGLGGKKKHSETIKSAAVREIYEESKLEVDENDLEKVAEIEFYFPSKEEWNQKVSVYFARRWRGTPVETEEMRPEWCDIKKIPYDKMWDSDKVWLRKVMLGEKIKAVYFWKEDNKTVDRYKIEKVDYF